MSAPPCQPCLTNVTKPESRLQWTIIKTDTSDSPCFLTHPSEFHNPLGQHRHVHPGRRDRQLPLPESPLQSDRRAPNHHHLPL